MGMLLFRVPADKETVLLYEKRLNETVQEMFGRDPKTGEYIWPVIAPDPYSITYTDKDGTVFACPGNGNVRLTKEVVEKIASIYAKTKMLVTYSEDGKGFEPVVKADVSVIEREI